MLRAVFFDLDDTLIDWSGFNDDWAMLERSLMGAVHSYFVDEGHLSIDLEGYLQAFRTRVMNAWIASRSSLKAVHIGQIIVETAGELGATVDRIDMERCLQAYAWGIVPGTVVFPDVVEALKLLIANDIQIGIVTNAPQPMVMRDLELTAHGLFEYFPDCRISAADAGYLKPHRAIFQLALDTLGIRADEAVFVGDDLDADIVGAGQMGIRSVLRITRHTAAGLRDEIVPDASVHSLSELPAVLDRWYPGWRRSDDDSGES
ncbi:MAG: HAD family hydrolase [Chloroflexota bacterium]|nr:HAD family hydrolase [Chloroflexota bacterium]